MFESRLSVILLGRAGERICTDKTDNAGRAGQGGGGVEQKASCHMLLPAGLGWRWESLMASGRLPNGRRRSGPGHATGT